MKSVFAALACLLMMTLGAAPAEAHRRHDDALGAGPPGATLLIIRHAEKPAAGPELSLAGEARARAYATYFQHLQIDGGPVRVSALVATADSRESERPRLTLEPLSHAIGVPIQQPFGDHDVEALARWLAAGSAGRTTLVAWHHGKLPKLLADLGADPTELLPGGAWPEDTYDWVVVLRYDQAGRLASARRLIEPKLVPTN